MAVKNTIITTVGATRISPTIAANTQQAIILVYLCNIDSSNVAVVNMNLTPALASVANSNLIYKQIEIAPGDTYILDTEKMILDAGESLYAGFDAVPGTVIATVNYTEV